MSETFIIFSLAVRYCRRSAYAPASINLLRISTKGSELLLTLSRGSCSLDRKDCSKERRDWVEMPKLVCNSSPEWEKLSSSLASHSR